MQFDEIDIQQIWQKILNIMEKNLNKATYETWVKRTEPLTVSGNVFIVGVPNEFAKDWLETRYNNFIEECISEITGQEIKVTYKILKILDQAENSSGEIKEIKPLPPVEKNNNSLNSNDYFISSLNPKYTFDTFVVGNSNKFAHAAALSVAESPARSYNPLFLYGGVGLGKTHIMHAVGQYILEQNPNAKILYLSSERFTNELINAIKDGKTLEFRNHYRNIDVLLVDDIQFIAGKEHTQEEFFHTFNALHENNKQIVISSDRPPKEIPTLESRLRSRFEWGLITDIQPPDLETRIAILRKKASMEKLNVPNDVMIYIANQIQANIRELEGALIRVVAYSSLNHSEINVQLAGEALRDILPANKRKQISIELIQQAVAEYYNLKFDDMKAKKRTKSLAFPRQVAMYLCRELTDSSLPKIGDEFGGRDHTTVIHAYEKIKDGLSNDQNLDFTIKELIKKIENS